MANKITKKDNFKAIVSILSNIGETDLVKIMEHEIELLDNKAGKKSAKISEEQKSFDTKVVSVMTEKPMTVTQIYNAMGKPDGVSAPKITASLKRLVGNGSVKNDKSGKTSVYFLV